MPYDEIEQKVKEFCETELNNARKFAKNASEVEDFRGIAFGALHFACNNLFPTYNKELADWWENDIWCQFRDVAIEKGNGGK